MNRILLSLFILVSLLFVPVSHIWGQSAKTELVGRVIDAGDKQAVPNATIQLFALPDSTFISGGVTNPEGTFKLYASPEKIKKSYIRVSFIGYDPVDKEIQFTGKGRIFNIGDIALSSSTFTLEETIITGKAPLAITENDTTVFNSAAYRTSEGAMLEDLVKQLPGGEITSDGKLFVQGKEVKKILVDGKEFFADDPKAALKNLPVEMVEKLKAYERKSDLARLTGIDDGDDEMILDLSVKKEMKQGWMESFFGGLGNKSRYELGNTLNRFRDNSQFTIIGNLNNTNNQGFSELQQESSSATGNTNDRRGFTTSRSLGMNLSKDWQRVTLRSNVQYLNTDHSEKNVTTQDNFLREEKSITKGNNNISAKNEGLTANVYLEWKIDSVTNLVFRPSYKYSSSKRTVTGFQESWADDIPVNEKESKNLTDNSLHNMNFMLQVNRKLSKTGRNIALRVDYGNNNSNSDRTNLSTTYYFKTGKERILNQKIDNGTDGYNYRLQLVYVEPLPKAHFLQFRYSYQQKISNSDRFTYNWDEDLGDFSVDFDSLNSNCFENRYSNHLINIAIRTSRKKYNYNLGVDLEPQKSVSKTFLGDVSKYDQAKNVLNFSPSVNFRYKFSKRTRLQITYRGKSRQPNVRDLQPIADMSNPLSIRIGNPSLKPSYTNTFNLNFNSYHAKKQRNMVLHVMAENVLNQVTNQVTYDSETGVRTTTPVNMSGNWNVLTSFSVNAPFRNKHWIYQTYTNSRYTKKNGYTTINKAPPLKSVVQEFILREQMKLTFRTRSVEISAKGDVLFNYSHNNISESAVKTFDYVAGADMQWFLPANFELASDLSYTLRTGYGYDEGREYFIWNAQLSKSFLKKKQLLLRFKVYDILRQEVAFVRTISATAIRDAEYNVLGRYFMAHLILRLNLSGRR